MRRRHGVWPSSPKSVPREDQSRVLNQPPGPGKPQVESPADLGLRTQQRPPHEFRDVLNNLFGPTIRLQVVSKRMPLRSRALARLNNRLLQGYHGRLTIRLEPDVTTSPIFQIAHELPDDPIVSWSVSQRRAGLALRRQPGDPAFHNPTKSAGVRSHRPRSAATDVRRPRCSQQRRPESFHGGLPRNC